MPIIMFIITVAALACLIVVMGFASSAIQQLISNKTANADHHKEESQHKPQDSQKALFPASDVAKAIDAYHQKRDAQEQDRAERDRITIIVLSFTGAFALLAAAAAITSDWIFYGQLTDAREAANIQHIDTLNALAKAEIANQTATTTQKLQLRAYVTVSELHQEPVGNMIALTPIIKNTGSTPATNLSIVMGTPQSEFLRALPYNTMTYSEVSWRAAAPADPDELFSSSNKSIFGILSNLVVGPGSVINAFELTTKISPQQAIHSQFHTANQPDVGSFLYGSIKYTDIFGASRATKYCFKTNGFEVTDTGPKPIQTMCAHWNCMDDQCKEDKEAYIRDVGDALNKIAHPPLPWPRPVQPMPP